MRSRRSRASPRTSSCSNGGRVVASGPIDTVFGPSATHAGEGRFARSSVLTGRIAGQHVHYGLTEIEQPAGTIWLSGSAGPPGREVRIVVRATDVTLATTAPHNLSVRTVLAGTIASIETDDGPLAAVNLDLDGGARLVALATRFAADELALKPGLRVFALIKTVALDERGVAPAPAAAPAPRPRPEPR